MELKGTPISKMRKAVTLTGKEAFAAVGDGNLQLDLNQISQYVLMYLKTQQYIANSPGSLFSASAFNFNGNRTVTRQGVPNINAGGETIKEFLEKYFFPFNAATISLNAFGLQEIGTSFTPVIQGLISPNSETSISNTRILDNLGNVKVSGLSGNTINWSDTPFTVALGNNIGYKIVSDVANNGNPSQIESVMRFVQGVYPVLIGLTTNGLIQGTDLYDATFNKAVMNQGSITSSFTITAGQRLFIAVPSTWGNLSSVIDNGGNGDNVTASFGSAQLRSVSSTGLTSNWTTNYKVYITDPKAGGTQLLKFDF